MNDATGLHCSPVAYAFQSMRLSLAALPFLLLAACDDAPRVTEPAKPQSQPQPQLATFERGRLSTPSAHPEQGRSFAPSTQEDESVVEDALSRLGLHVSTAAVESALASVRHVESAELLRVASALQQHAEADVRLLGLTLLEGYSDSRVLPFILTAVKDSAVDVRIESMELAQYQRSADILPALTSALADSNVSVRQLALQSALKQDAATEAKILDAAVSSPFQDVAAAALAHTEARPQKANIGRAIMALDHSHPQIREQAHEMLSLLFHQSFPNSRAAQTWWQKYAPAFNDDLVMTDSTLATELANGR
jgi:hypothetical protein